MEFYRLLWQESHRLNPDAYIEAGVHTPAFSRAYAHTFRLADDDAVFSAPYPASGLVEHIDYAVYQQVVLGQRPNLGAASDSHGGAAINLSWLEAAIALDSLATLSFDLSTLGPSDVSAYRALLNHHRPFTGQTQVDQLNDPSIFVTRKNDLVYLGLLNRGNESLPFAVPLRGFGVSESEHWAFDVTTKTVSKASNVFRTTLAPRSFRLFILSSKPTVIWTSSSYTSNATTNRLSIELRGPSHVAGQMMIVGPRPRRVKLDGHELMERSLLSVSSTGHYVYHESGGLDIEYGHDQPHHLEVEY